MENGSDLEANNRLAGQKKKNPAFYGTLQNSEKMSRSNKCDSSCL